jgi:predicted dehydrogenase
MGGVLIMAEITAVLLGAGGRGMYTYGEYALKHPDEIRFVAVAEPNIERRERFVQLHSISKENTFESWEQLMEKQKLADAAIICTQDRMHFEPSINAIEKGYHVLLEKPMSHDPSECIKMGGYAERHERIFSICHVLRYTDFFSTLKKLLEQGRIGKLVSIQHNENVAFWHYAHSYVRGMWRNSEQSGPMILTKSCHDMDIMLWLAGADCINISSNGSLMYFKEENAPEGAPKRCLDGCPAEPECPYFAPKTYLADEERFYPFQFMLCTDQSVESRLKAMKESQYGRCVYYCDNNVVDHQVVGMEFANGVTAAFTMCAFTNECSRTLKLMGTQGEIRGNILKNEIEITDFAVGRKDLITLRKAESGHEGGDEGIMRDFVRLFTGSGRNASLTSAKISVQSHLMAFAAEKSRLEGCTINMKDYMKSLK